MRINKVSDCSRVNKGSGVDGFLNALQLNGKMYGSIVQRGYKYII